MLIYQIQYWRRTWHAHTHPHTYTYTYTHLSTGKMRMWAYRPYACDRPSLYLSIRYKGISSFVFKSGWEFDERERFFSKNNNRKKEETYVANQFFSCRDMSCDLGYSLVTHVFIPTQEIFTQPNKNLKTFGPSSSKSKRRGKKSRCSLPFSSISLCTSIHLSLTLLFISSSFSLARSSVPLFPRLIDGQHSREHRALVLHCIWWYVYEYWLRVWRYI